MFVGVLAFMTIEMTHQYAVYIMGFATRRDDVTSVYYPMARGVLRGGDLYITQWDNRPPLFQFLNIAVGATGEYMLVFYLLLAVANAVTAILLWRLSSRHFPVKIGLLAGLIYVFALPIAHGQVIGARPFSNILILGSFLIGSPAVSGLLLAGAGLFHQYSVFVIPAALYYHYAFSPVEIDLRWILKFSVAGLMLVGISYLFVGLVWGLDSLTAGIRYTFFGAGDYVLESRSHSILSNPPIWLGNEWQTVRSHSLYYLSVVVAVFAWHRESASNNGKRTSNYQSVPVFAVAAILLSLPRLIRNAELYNLLPLPFVSLLSAVGLWFFYQNSDLLNE